MVKIGDVCPLFFNPIKDKFGIEVDYIQKFYTGDNIHLQIFANVGESVSATLIDLINDTSTSINLSTYNQNSEVVMHYAVLTGLPDSDYKVNVNGILSEPFCVSSSSELLERTTLIKYSHKDNNSVFNNIFWIGGTQVIFDWRVEAGFKPNGYTPKLENEQYRNQWQEIKNLYSVPYDSYVLTIGDACGVPYWYGRHLNRILCLSKFIVKDTGFVRSENSVPEMSQVIEDSQLFNITCGIEPQYNDISGKESPEEKETYSITVGINPSNIGQCTVTATGNVISITSSADSSKYVVEANAGGTVTINIVAEDGYQVQQLNVDQVSQGAIDNYTFENINANHTMYVWMEVIADENPTDFLIRSDKPDTYYSSTHVALNAIKSDYPNGLTENITLSCVKVAKERRLSNDENKLRNERIHLAVLKEWNKGSMYTLTIDGADMLTYDCASLGGFMFKNVDNILLKNISFINFCNYIDGNTPDEIAAVMLVGNMNSYCRNLYVDRCKFNGISTTNNATCSTYTISTKYTENVYFYGCIFMNNAGIVINMNDSRLAVFVKNNISGKFRSGAVSHAGFFNVTNGYYIIMEDNELDGSTFRESLAYISNIDNIVLRRNNLHGGARCIEMSSNSVIKNFILEENLIVNMLNSPLFGWIHECFYSSSDIENFVSANNTLWMGGNDYLQYICRFNQADTRNVKIYNNIVVDPDPSLTTGKFNIFNFKTVGSLSMGYNLFKVSIRDADTGQTYGEIVAVSNPDEIPDSITITGSNSRSLNYLRNAGYDDNTTLIFKSYKLLDIENGGNTYAITDEYDADYPANNADVPEIDFEYKRKLSTGNNSRGCYNLHGMANDELADTTSGYIGEDLTLVAGFNSSVQYNAIADSILLLIHNTLNRAWIVRFSVIGQQHQLLAVGKYALLHTYPELNSNEEYQADEVYTINID